MSFSLDQYATMGLDAVAIGASSTIEERLQDLDNKVRAHDGAVFKAGVDWYGPGGLMSAHPDDTNTVAQEQTYAKGWNAFLTDWDTWYADRTKKLDDARTASKAWGGGTIYDDTTKIIEPELAKKEAAFAGWALQFEKVVASHGKKQLPELQGGGSAFPWKVVLAVSAVGIVGAVIYMLKKQADAARAEQEAQRIRLPESYRIRRPDGDDRPTLVMPNPPRGVSMSPPEPLPQMNMRLPNKTLLSGT